MAMRKAFTGGACAPGGEGQAMGNNAFTNMMDYMISGGANASQKAEGFGPQMDQQNMAAMEAAFANQEQMNAMNNQFENMNMNQPQMMQSPMVQELPSDNVAHMNGLWDMPTSKIEDVRTSAVDQQYSNMQHNPGMFGIPGMMGPMMHQPMPQNMGPINHGPQEEVKVEVTEGVTKEDKQMHNDEMKETTAFMINQLNSLPSEKVQNSEFLSFLKKLNTGAYKIEDNGLETDENKMKEFTEKEVNQKKMDAAYYKQQINNIVEETKDPNFKIEETAGQHEFGEDFDPANLFRDVWETGEMKEDDLQNMMAGWKTQAEKSMGYYNETLDEPPVETVFQVPKEDFFKFDENNPYIDVEDAYSLAVQLNSDLKVHDAVLAIKAHLTQNPDHAASWRLLGQLYQEKDEDEKAIAYFQKAYDLDPYDLDSLLCLGVSCTNELNENVAMNHLTNWLRYNPEYCDLQIPEHQIQDPSELRDVLRTLFRQAHEKNPADVDVVIALGILEFGERNYQNAADLFGKAANDHPRDYNLWNKFGAAMANNLSTEEALKIYDKTLELRPNLVRTWNNVGIAY